MILNETIFKYFFGLVESVVIGRFDEEVDLLAGSRHIMPYNLAADLILDERVQLI